MRTVRQAVPTQAPDRCEGFDANGHWLLWFAYAAIEERGAIVNIGQIGPFVERRLNALAKAGTLVKYRGYWNTLHPICGLGPLKTIWATPEFAALVPGLKQAA